MIFNCITGGKKGNAPSITLDESNNQIDTINVGSFEVPTEVDGRPLNTTLTPTSTTAMASILWAFHEMVIPEYFTAVNCSFALRSSDEYPRIPFRRLIYNGTGAFNPTSLNNIPLEYIKVNSRTDLSLRVLQHALPVNEITIEAPETTMLTVDGGTSANIITLHVIANKATFIGNRSATLYSYRYCNGDITAPKATQVGISYVPLEGTMKHYLPAITSPYATTSTNGGFVYKTVPAGTGIAAFYFGPNLETWNPVDTTTITNSAGRVEIHIPAGESTTKNTLDAAGVSYIQDYIPEV